MLNHKQTEHDEVTTSYSNLYIKITFMVWQKKEHVSSGSKWIFLHIKVLKIHPNGGVSTKII